MKFTCEKALLQSAISISSRAVSPKSSISALEGILVNATDELQLTGYNLSTGIRTIVAADITEPGSLVLSAHLFGDIIRRLPDDVVSFSAQGTLVHIECGMSEFNIMGTDPEEFPDLPLVEYEHTITLPRNVMRTMITQTIFAVSTNESRPIHTGSLFEVSADKTLTVVSVDGYRLALRREKVEAITGKPDFSFVVPAAALSEVEKICGESEDNAEIVVGSRHVMFKVGDTMLVSRRLEGEFLAYRQAIPQEYKIVMVSDKRTLLNSIDRVSLIITEKQKSPIRCLFEVDNMKIRVNTALGDASDECPMSGDGMSLEIGFNNKYMLDALKAAPADTLELRMNSPISPCIITPSDGKDNFLYMVLPVRLRAGQ
jgi:DNA polymerase-3 subunit beta